VLLAVVGWGVVEFSGLGELSPARVSCSGEVYYRFIAILVINEGNVSDGFFAFQKR
jgi:hypothetical protein